MVDRASYNLEYLAQGRLQHALGHVLNRNREMNQKAFPKGDSDTRQDSYLNALTLYNGG